jgi:flagellar basal body L-ring protein FlgH
VAMSVLSVFCIDVFFAGNFFVSGVQEIILDAKIMFVKMVVEYETDTL